MAGHFRHQLHVNTPYGRQSSRDSTRHAMYTTDEDMILSPDRLLASTYIGPEDRKNHRKSSAIRMSSRIPKWLWIVLSYTLGINRGKRIKEGQRLVSLFLHVLTLALAFSFGACGLIFNIFDAISDNTSTDALEGTVKSFLGLFWILLGTYSHSLAASLFNNKGLLDYIRLHSNAFMKIGSGLWVTILSVTVVVVHIYSDVYILSDSKGEPDENEHQSTCVHVGLQLILCQIYFGCKVAFSCLNLAWNLMIAGVCLSVTWTHAVCIQRFMSELNYDFRIFEEVRKIKRLQQNIGLATSSPEELIDYEFIYDEDFQDMEKQQSPGRGTFYQQMRLKYQRKLYDSLHKFSRTISGPLHDIAEDEKWEEDENGDTLVEVVRAKGDHVEDHIESNTQNGERRTSQSSMSENEEPQLLQYHSHLINNDDILFTYYTLVRHLKATSLMMRRWMASWIIFVMLWCIVLIIYWTSHIVKITGIIQFIIPLIVIGFLTSAYAGVNYEGSRLPKCILPTVERMVVICYIKDVPLELKIYGLLITYNILATVVAGMAVTVFTRIALENIL